MKTERKDNDKLVVVSSKWSFLKEEIPDFIKSPLDAVVSFIEGLPFLGEEEKKKVIRYIKSMQRDKR